MPSKKLILTIDDDPDILSSLKLTLEAGGYQVVTADNGADGLKQFQESVPSLIICDIMMEKIDTGIRLVREIRGRDKQVPIFLLSDIGKLTSANIDIYEMGCNGALQKPFNADELLRLVKQALDK